MSQNDYETLLAFWNNAFSLTPEEKAQFAEAPEELRQSLIPSEKLLAAARELSERSSVLDYGCGDGWAGIAIAESGCPKVTCADPAPNAVEAAAFLAALFHVEDRVRAVCIDDAWLSRLPDHCFDGLFCSNVLDVVPPELAEAILENIARVVTRDAAVVIGLNYYLPPERAAEKGLECRNGNCYYVDGILRLVSRTDADWRELFERYFSVERLEYFAWPGEPAETRRLFRLRPKAVDRQ